MSWSSSACAIDAYKAMGRTRTSSRAAQVIGLYFFESGGTTPFYQEARKVYSNQPLAGISSIPLHFPAASLWRRPDAAACSGGPEGPRRDFSTARRGGRIAALST